MKSIYWKLSSNWERGDHISGGWGMFVDWKIKEIGKIELAPSSGLSATFSAKENARRSYRQRLFPEKSFSTRIFSKPKHY